MTDKKTAPSAGKPVRQSGDAVVVRARDGLKRFCRAGMCFGQSPQRLVVSTLGDGVLATLKAEPNLILEVADDPVGQ